MKKCSRMNLHQSTMSHSGGNADAASSSGPPSGNGELSQSTTSKESRFMERRPIRTSESEVYLPQAGEPPWLARIIRKVLESSRESRLVGLETRGSGLGQGRRLTRAERVGMEVVAMEVERHSGNALPNADPSRERGLHADHVPPGSGGPRASRTPISKYDEKGGNNL